MSATLVVAAGCNKGPVTGTVQGKVTLDDQPYADASVVFLSPTSGQAASVDIQSDGSFKIEAPVPVGTYTVYLAPKSGGQADQPTAAYMSGDKTVPEKYWSEATSDIKIEVKEGPNDVTVPLKKS